MYESTNIATRHVTLYDRLSKTSLFPGVRLGDERDGNLLPLGCGNSFDELALSVHLVSGFEQKIEVDSGSW